MTAILQPLRDEHKELYPHVEAFRTAADAIDAKMSPAGLELLAQTYDFLANHLLVHAKAEEAALYPVVREVMGTASGTATMSRDHREVEDLTGELGALRQEVSSGNLTPAQVASLRRVLYGLYTLVKVHFAKEEEVYLPLLEAALQPAAATALFENMERAAHHAREHAAA